MINQDSWHSQDAFWELFEPVLFNQQRLSSTQGEVEKIEKLLQIEGRRQEFLISVVGRVVTALNSLCELMMSSV